MIDSKYREKYQTLFIDRLLRLAFIKRLNPSALTLIGLFFGVLIPYFLYFGFPILGILFLGLSGFLDTLDGSLARIKNQTSDRGAVLDITSDRIVEFAIILGLFLVDPVGRGLSSICMLGSTLFCITTFLVVGIFSQNKTEKSFYYSPGIIERAEAFTFFGAMILFPSAFWVLAILYIFLVFLTGAIRIYQFLYYPKLATMPLEELNIEESE